MAFVNCFDIVEAVIREKDKSEFFKGKVIDEENLDILKDYCSVIDKIVKEYGGSEMSAMVNDDNGKIMIFVECIDLFTEGTTIIHDLIERAVSVMFYQTSHGEGALGIKFVFPSVWKSKEERI